MLSVAEAERSLNIGVPVLSKYFEAWCSKLNHLKPAKLETTESSFRRALMEHGSGYAAKKSLEVTMEARVSFELAFGLTIEEQIAMESKLILFVENYELVNDFVKSRFCVKQDPCFYEIVD